MKFEFMPRYTKYLCWYQTEMKVERSHKFLDFFTVVCLLLIAIGILSVMLNKCTSEPQPVYKSHYSEAEMKLAAIFADHGSPNPMEMAIAVRKTKNPPLMAAIAIKESNGKPNAVGDSGKSKGAFQVQEKHWGKVGITATEQALQSEHILEELVQSSRGRLRYALAKYNGGDKPPRISYSYADKVIKLSKTIRKEIRHG